MEQKSTNKPETVSKKRRIFDIIQIGNTSDTPSRVFDDVLIVMILVNIVMMFLQTFERFEPYMDIINVLEGAVYS